MKPVATTPYFETQQFIDDCEALAQVSPENVEAARLAICLRWSDDLIAKGGFPSVAATEAQAKFVIGDISVDDLRAQLNLAELKTAR